MKVLKFQVILPEWGILMKCQLHKHLFHTSPSIAIKKSLKLNRCQEMTQADRCQEGVSQVELSYTECTWFVGGGGTSSTLQNFLIPQFPYGGGGTLGGAFDQYGGTCPPHAPSDHWENIRWEGSSLPSIQLITSHWQEILSKLLLRKITLVEVLVTWYLHWGLCLTDFMIIIWVILTLPSLRLLGTALYPFCPY